MTIELPRLPALDALPGLRSALAAGGCAVLSAPPGSGKTTLLPLALMDEPWLAGRRIVMLEPRRLAARASAARMAQLLGEPVGQRVGYQVRFERRVSERTRVEVVTEGLLARRLQSDPELTGTGLLIFDEFHERSLDADLALALALDARRHLVPDLRILVMSATIDGARVATLLDDAPRVEASGRQYPVEVRHLGAPKAGEPMEPAVAQAVERALREQDGSVLAFLPGAREIRRTQGLLEGRLAAGIDLFPLYGDLSSDEQDAALRPSPAGRRKVILATNIAQTSLTVEGVTGVVDSGWVRVARYDLGAGANRLQTERVSVASADQRAGRAGRLGPGVCYRLWSAEQQAMMPAHDSPEIAMSDLSGFALQLAAWGCQDPGELSLLDAPPEAAWNAARDILLALQAIEPDGRITAAGKRYAGLPTSPRRAHMLIEGAAQGLGLAAAWTAAVLDEREGGADLADRVQRAAAGRPSDRGPFQTRDAARQFLRLIKAENSAGVPEERDIARVIALAFPERLAQLRAGKLGVWQCADGSEARSSEHDPLAATEWLAIAHWDPGPPRRIRSAVRFDPACLASDHPQTRQWIRQVAWDRQAQCVIAEERRQLGAIVLERRPLRGAGEEILAALLAGVRDAGLALLPWSDGALQIRARLAAVAAWRPDEGWPDVSDAGLLATLEDWLGPWAQGISRREQLGRIDLAQALLSPLDYAATQRLASLAPTHLAVPSGSRIALDYPLDGGEPVLAVKLQELFGCVDTPTVDGGRRKVTLHLLSPARRPIQVTRDLASFWANTYAEVKKELKGRYPKHPWPEDPLQAPPTARAKPRGT